MKKKTQPKLCNCLKCGNKVFEFEDGYWGCDTCKSVWKYAGRVWVNTSRRRRKLKTQV